MFDVNVIHHAIENVPFFRPENMEYYATFFNDNPHLTPEQIVLYVNIGLMYEFYERIHFVPDSYDYRVLVNKFNRSEASFSPSDLVSVAPGQYLRQSPATAFLAMQEEMQGLGLPIVARSGYRPYTIQRQLVENNLAVFGPEFVAMWNAQPGHSEHQLGLAVDILQPGQAAVSLGNANFGATPQYSWLQQNAHRFGFILSYPAAYTHVTGFAYEPWHWRYVGEETATYMFINRIPTLDHYWATRIVYIPQYTPLLDNDTQNNLYPNNDYNYYIEENPQPTLTVQQTENTSNPLNPVLLSVGNTNIYLAYVASLVFIIILGLVVVRQVTRTRIRNRRFARQFDFDSRTSSYQARKRGTRNRNTANRRYR